MNVIKGFFFDLDGTLLNTREADYLSYRDALAEFGVQMTREHHAQTFGKDSRQFIPEIAPHLTPEEVKNVRERKKAHYPNYLHTVKPNDSLVAFLKAMHKQYITVLVTTAKQANGEQVLRAQELYDHFTHRIFGDKVQNPKPHPQSYEQALKVSGLKPEEVVVFEDSHTGIASAQAAGISAVVQIKAFA